MSNKSKEPLALVTGVDDKFVFIWSSEYPLEELRFPVKLGAQRPQLGQKVQYVCTKSSQEVQYGGILKKVEGPSPVLIQPDGDFVIETHVAFPSPGSNYCLRELAMAEDYHIRFYCHSVDMGTVVSFRDWDYNWQKIYKVHLRRFPKHCDWMIPRVSTMWRICNLQEVTDSVKAAQISSQMPWNNALFDDELSLIPMQLSMLDAEQTNIDQNPASFYTQSTSQITTFTDPIISIEEDNSYNKTPNCNLSGCEKKRLPRNDFSDLVTDAILSDAVPEFGVVQKRQIDQTASQIAISNYDSKRFNDFGIYVSTVLSKTPQHKIEEAIKLTNEIFAMCANKQIELLRGNVG